MDESLSLEAKRRVDLEEEVKREKLRRQNTPNQLLLTGSKTFLIGLCCFILYYYKVAWMTAEIGLWAGLIIMVIGVLIIFLALNWRARVKQGRT